MKSKIIAVGVAALAMTACDMQAKSAAISPNSTDDQKFAYMLGAQFGGQNFVALPRQVGEPLDEDVVVQAVLDAQKANTDTTFKVQLSDDTLQAVGARYSNIARERMSKTRPDSATMASFAGDQAKMRAYIDSVNKALPMAPATPVKNAPVKLDANSTDNQKFSYLIGLQFGNQFVAIGNQFETEFDVNYFVLGVRDAGVKTRDTTKTLQLPEDSLKAVGERFNEKMKTIREAAMKKQQEEMEKLKAEVNALRGDTLVNGMPAKINFKVKATGITVKGETIEAFAGKPLLIFYFSATCGHCAHAAPSILEMAKEFAPQGLTTLAISSGGNSKSGIRKFMDNAKWDETVNVMFDESRQFGELYSDGYVPKVYLVNPDGTYKQYASFEKDKPEMKADIAALMKGQNVVWKLEAPAPVDTAAPVAPAAPAKAEAPAAPAAPAK